MAVEFPGQCISLATQADLSTHQHKAMKIGTADLTCALQTSLALANIGILQNKPSATGAAADIMVSGVTKWIVGANTVTAGDFVGSDANGLCDVAATTKNCNGQALTTGLTGETISVLLGGVGSVE
jgi:hypothetical protein